MQAEGFRNGDAMNAQFRYPVAIVFDKQGNLFVADDGNFCIRKITTDGIVLTFSGSGTGGSADGDHTTAQFNFINDMVTDSQGNLYVADDNRVRKITSDGTVSTIGEAVPVIRKVTELLPDFMVSADWALMYLVIYMLRILRTTEFGKSVFNK